MSKELVRALKADIDALLDEQIYSEMSIAEVVGVFQVIQFNLIHNLADHTIEESEEPDVGS